mgnify:CR=1 FL=1
MGRKEIEKAVETLLEPCLEKEGIELVDVEYVRERDLHRQRGRCRFK